MPCRDERNEAPYLYQEASNKNKKLEAMLCALLSELAKESNFDSIVYNAEKQGNIDILAFWTEHKESDRIRVANKLDSLSEHEKKIALELLTKKFE